MGTNVDIKDGKYIITSTVTDESTKPLTLKQAIGDRICDKIVDHRVDTIKIYLSFPYGYFGSDLKRISDNEQGSDDAYKLTMAIYRRDDYWEVLEKIYNRIIEILEGDEEYIPYREIPLINEILTICEQIEAKNNPA